MATILDRYGIKEVADVTFYEINTDGTPGKPVLYLDTLKVSTIEQTAESTDARGGKGNAALVSWDYGKEITVTLEDALYSAKSLALMFGDVDEKGVPNDLAPEVKEGETYSVKKTVWAESVAKVGVGETDATITINNKNYSLSGCIYYDAAGKEVESPNLEEADEDGNKKPNFAYVTGNLKVTEALKIDVSANTFPGTYYITGDTYARNEANGVDDFFQFIIPKAKVLSESNTITLEAEGDPTVFSMNLKVLRPKNGRMMELVQYTLDEAKAE